MSLYDRQKSIKKYCQSLLEIKQIQYIKCGFSSVFHNTFDIVYNVIVLKLWNCEENVKSMTTITSQGFKRYKNLSLGYREILFSWSLGLRHDTKMSFSSLVVDTRYMQRSVTVSRQCSELARKPTNLAFTSLYFTKSKITVNFDGQTSERCQHDVAANLFSLGGADSCTLLEETSAEHASRCLNPDSNPRNGSDLCNMHHMDAPHLNMLL